MSAELVTILEGNTFVVSDRRGDIEASLTDPTGLFRSTRATSRGGCSASMKSGCNRSPSTTSITSRRASSSSRGRGPLRRHQALCDPSPEGGDGFREELTVLNHDGSPVDVRCASTPGRLRRPLRGQGRDREARHVSAARPRRRSSCSSTRGIRSVARRPSPPQLRPAGRAWHDLRRATRASRVMDDEVGGRRRHGVDTTERSPDAAGGAARASNAGWRKRPLGVRLGAAETHVPAEPRRPGGAAVLAADHAREGPRPRPACRGS